jgi:hypothetical protein
LQLVGEILEEVQGDALLATGAGQEVMHFVDDDDLRPHALEELEGGDTLAGAAWRPDRFQELHVEAPLARRGRHLQGDDQGMSRTYREQSRAALP